MELDILLNPYNGQPLQWAKQNGRTGLADAQGYFFPVRNGYPNFLAGQQLTGLNAQFQRFYDRMSRVAGLLERVFDHWFQFDRMREEWLRGLSIHPGDRVLEVSVGTGSNIRKLPAYARYYGLDISSGMLDRCVKNARRWEMPMELCQGNAEYLPYRDNSFDSVFHVGGINFFNDRGRAIREMIRVAKPGARIVIIDETAKEVKAQFRKIHFMRGYLRDASLDRSRWYAPAQFVPDEIRDVEVKLIDNGAMYRLSFVKPVEELKAMYKVG